MIIKSFSCLGCHFVACIILSQLAQIMTVKTSFVHNLQYVSHVFGSLRNNILLVSFSSQINSNAVLQVIFSTCRRDLFPANVL